MIVITKIIVTPTMTGTIIYVTRRSWLLSLFDSDCGEERKVDSLVVVTIVLVGKDIGIVAVLSTKNKDSYSI